MKKALIAAFCIGFLTLALGGCASEQVLGGQAATATPVPPTPTLSTELSPSNGAFQDAQTGYWIIQPVADWYWKNNPNRRVGRPIGPLTGDYRVQLFEWGVVLVDQEGHVFFYSNGQSPEAKNGR